jgi:hypothetical protein
MRDKPSYKKFAILLEVGYKKFAILLEVGYNNNMNAN